jgi:L-lactate dehydrogenase complex protein LldF
MLPHATSAEKFLNDRSRSQWHDDTLWFVREKRDQASRTIPEWEALREAASRIKDDVLANLDEYLIQFEEQASANGIEVLWAADAQEHNEHVAGILMKHNVHRLVKSKSILTEECHLNEFLEARGYDVVDTDLGERIVQFLKQPPSHIVMPAIHLKKKEIGDIFHEKIGTRAGEDDPQRLTEAARGHLRQKFLEADAALTGVNFAVAETGGFVVCTNEGNADMGVHLAPVHIACMGIEKIIPRAEHLGVFLRLLARSATGQSITSYTSHYHRPREGCRMYIVVVDNGRSRQLGRPDFRTALKCIRCGACMNTCPVYRRSGGYSYGFTVPGPIGSILSPNLDLKSYRSLPFASTLCGSCSDVCPVKINIHEQLFKWRQVVSRKGGQTFSKRIGLMAAGWLFANPRIFRWSGAIARSMLAVLPRMMVYNGLNPWGKAREVPEVPGETFREWYLKNKKEKHGESQ